MSEQFTKEQVESFYRIAIEARNERWRQLGDEGAIVAARSRECALAGVRAVAEAVAAPLQEQIADLQVGLDWAIYSIIKECGGTDNKEGWKRKLSTHRRDLLGLIEEAYTRISQLEEKQYVPGVWRCDTCNFQVSKNVMNVANGTVGADRSEDLEGCPNDGLMMRRVTWEQYCTQTDAAFMSQVEAREAAEKRVAELEARHPVQLGKKLFEFATHLRWVTDAQRMFRECGVPSHKTISLDAKGRVCSSGLEMGRAKDEKTFPVTVYSIIPEEYEEKGEGYFHIHLSIPDALALPAAEFLDQFGGMFRTKADGGLLDMTQVREIFLQLLQAGQEVFVMDGCDNYDPKTGCLGHKS